MVKFKWLGKEKQQSLLKMIKTPWIMMKLIL